MKLFGIDFKIQRTPKVKTIQDKIPDIQSALPSAKTNTRTTKPVMMTPVSDPSLRYESVKYAGRGNFQAPEYDLAEIGRIEDVESYVRRSFNLKTGLMFKEGFDIVGPDLTIIKYIKARLEQIAQASNVPTQKLFRDIGTGLVKKSNTFIAKVRSTKSSGGKIRKIPGKSKSLDPVAGYFIVPAETMEYELVGNKITKWRQNMPDGTIGKEFNPEDIIHFYYDQKEGFIFGTPTLVPVIDDIRALRKIEENIELLVYQHLFPLFHYKVGTETAPAGMTEEGYSEIEIVKQEIQYMPSEGGIVTPERHEIKILGAEGRALRAEKYLEHFKKRVLAGIGVSSVDLGDGSTTNRSTSETMSRNLVDTVKDFQQVMEIFVNEFIIKELLLESTLGDSVLDSDKRCFLKFKEIDIDAQIKKEAHYADQFNKDVITWDELRTAIGYEPIPTPTREEIESEQDTAEKYPQWHKTRWKLFEEPKLLIQAVDEAWSVAAKALARSGSTGTTEGDIETAKKEQLAIKKAEAKQVSKPKVKNFAVHDAVLSNTFLEVKQDLVERILNTQDINTDWVSSLIRTQMSTTIDQLVSIQMINFRKGYQEVTSIDKDFIYEAKIARAFLFQRTDKYITKLTDQLINMYRRHSDISDKTELLTKVRSIFDSLEYRTRFIEDVEVRKAFYYGLMLGAKKQGTLVKSEITDLDCDICQQHKNDTLSYKNIILEDLPPYHAHCSCSIKAINIGMQVADSIEDKKTQYKKVGPKSKQSQFTACKIKAFARLKAQHPELDDQTIEAMAEAACDHHLQNSETEDNNMEKEKE